MEGGRADGRSVEIGESERHGTGDDGVAAIEGTGTGADTEGEAGGWEVMDLDGGVEGCAGDAGPVDKSVMGFHLGKSWFAGIRVSWFFVREMRTQDKVTAHLGEPNCVGPRVFWSIENADIWKGQNY